MEMPDWAITVLKQGGIWGVFIMALLIGIAWLAKVTVTQAKNLRTLHEQRATEREKLVQLMESGIDAQRMTTTATDRRTEMMERLSNAIMTQANGNDRLNDRVMGQAEMFKEKLGEFKHVVDAFGEAHRVNSGILSEVRNLAVGHGNKMDAIMVAIASARQLRSPRRRPKKP
jgi:hypothetical protein